MANTDFTSQDMYRASYDSTAIKSLTNRCTFTPVNAEVHDIFDIPSGAHILSAAVTVVQANTAGGTTTVILGSATPSDTNGLVEVVSLNTVGKTTGFGTLLGTHDAIGHASALEIVKATIATNVTATEVIVDFSIIYVAA